ncbi:MAG: EscU/YscU/HrcU family type III secretion system export apparatus switch protein [Nitrospirae bacterium]|nr:EscU/YscU/HrcU family type III secretion system export apparatus switch protein [Nitrospirota bacterium]
MREEDAKPERRREAVALRYDGKTDEAPKVTAKGQGLVAERIIDAAREHGIPMREDPDIVAVLAKLQLYEEIPPALYKAVAEILAFVYRMNRVAAAK